MEGQVLESVYNNPYLGVEVSSTLSWDTHIGNILAKANRYLEGFFVHRDLLPASKFAPLNCFFYYQCAIHLKITREELSTHSIFISLQFPTDLLNNLLWNDLSHNLSTTMAFPSNFLTTILVVLKLQYSQRHSVINHCDRRTTLLNDTDIFFVLFNLFTYFLVHFGW
jgi:hypothetical protein